MTDSDNVEIRYSWTAHPKV